jgi:transposase-like protein
MSTRRHRRHSTELKLRLVKAYLDGEGSFKSIAKENLISTIVQPVSRIEKR